MTRRDAYNRLRILYQQLEIMDAYPESFLEILGTKGFQERIDEILDEIIFLKKWIKKHEKEK